MNSKFVGPEESLKQWDYEIIQDSEKNFVQLTHYHGNERHLILYDQYIRHGGLMTAIYPIDLCSLFWDNEKTESIDRFSQIQTGNVINMNSMFKKCRALRCLDLSYFDTHNVENMSGMFEYCNTVSELDLSNFNTSRLKTTRFMFGNCINLSFLNVSNFDTSKVKDMRGMFKHCESITSLDLTSFDTSQVLDMGFLFKGCKNLKEIKVSKKWVIQEECDTRAMFQDCGTDHVIYIDE